MFDDEWPTCPYCGEIMPCPSNGLPCPAPPEDVWREHGDKFMNVGWDQ